MHDLQAAVRYRPDPSDLDQVGYETIIPLTYHQSSRAWLGEREIDSVIGYVRFRFDEVASMWTAGVGIRKPGAPIDFADFEERPYQGGKPFVTQLATEITRPRRANLSLRIAELNGSAAAVRGGCP